MVGRISVFDVDIEELKEIFHISIIDEIRNILNLDKVARDLLYRYEDEETIEYSEVGGILIRHVIGLRF